MYAVNDGAVMSAWAKDQAVAGSKFITLLGDTQGNFTRMLGLVVDHPAVNSIFGLQVQRSKRVAMYVVDGIVKIMRVADRGPNDEDDPVGADYPEPTLAPAMIEAIKQYNTLKSEAKL